MEGIKNINKKLLIAIFTVPFLIGFIYSVYSQGTSAQNNAAISSLESNSIIQWIINSSINGYSTAGQSLASFISINGIPSYVWTIITFLIVTLFFVAIYAFLFEIFMQKIKGANISESETMKKAKILFIFILSIFSAISIGYAIPFLLNLYGFILLVLALVALFFFGRAAISYGKSFHYATKSFEADVKKSLLKTMEELEELENKRNLSKVDVRNISELLNVLKENYNLYEELSKALETADKKFNDTLYYIKMDHVAFFSGLRNRYEETLNKIMSNLKEEQKNKLNAFLDELDKKKNTDIEDIEKLRKIRSIEELYYDVLNQIKELDKDSNIDKKVISELQQILDDEHKKALGYKNQILESINDTLNEYNKAKTLLLQMFHKYETTLKKKISSRLWSILIAHIKPDELEKFIKRELDSVDERIKFLEELKTRY
ncbi:MAG: hypothetical protein RXQ68_02805 [Candidatus Nanopusillus sp.]